MHTSHLAVKQGVYYFVRRVPSDLVRYYRSTRVSYSLRTWLLINILCLGSTATNPR
ncbi:MAG: DUF6538 domain-containing protein [bacterium]